MTLRDSWALWDGAEIIASILPWRVRVKPAKYALTWDNCHMALGRSQVQQGFDNPRDLLGDRLREGSLYRLLADHGHRMFPDGYFADLYTESVKGRPTVAARVVATVMPLQARLPGLRPPGGAAAGRRAAGRVWAGGCRREGGKDLLRRHAAAAGNRGQHRGHARAAVPGRADHRAGPAQPQPL
jgi:hypothetical protein